MTDGKVPFDARCPDLDAVRQIVFERIKRDTSWSQLDTTGDGFAPYADYLGQDGRRTLLFLAQEVFWQLVGRWNRRG
jgi:hypothetical protein